MELCDSNKYPKLFIKDWHESHVKYVTSFQKGFEKLPLVGFSVCSGIEIIRQKLHPSNTVAFKSWDSLQMPLWAKNRVEAGMYVVKRILSFRVFVFL